MEEILLVERSFERTARQLTQRLLADPRAGSVVDLWLFEGPVRRRRMEAELAQAGIRARVFSAYKPLLHYFLEHVDRGTLKTARIVYPRHTACPENRFLLETHPLVDLFPMARIDLVPATTTADADLPAADNGSTGTVTPLAYDVTLGYASGRSETLHIPTPNVVGNDFLGQPFYTPSAWMVAINGNVTRSEPLAADYSLAYQAAMAAVINHDWGRAEPYFDRLTISVRLPCEEQRLDCGDETISLAEALHEELYFSILEYFQQYSGRPPGNRGLQPGQIVPDITIDNNAESIRVTVTTTPTPTQHRAPKQLPAVDTRDIPGKTVALPAAVSPLPFNQIEKALQAYQGRHITFASSQGRPVNVVHVPGHLPAVLISAAQHANETSGVVGALRATGRLAARPDAHFVLMPVENPDGYALHQALCATHPTHMHHAARYTALGDDVEYREHAPWYERLARNHAFETSGAQLHLNLHGYPAHEWTRPCTGYLPRGFEIWSLPKGFFLILRYKAAWRDTAFALLRHVAQSLAGNPRLRAFNEEQLRRYERHSGHMPFLLEAGVPYTAVEAPNQTPGVTLITEFPDETLHGEAFVFAHSVQAQTVEAACDWWWANVRQ
ncbi:MAG TPA: M14 family zinc carboxypeptidase [Burkholderiaceae bacterium]|nr:M14 family zinc carboxypeptidase [Burkholderiaceae bacterium]